MDMKKLLESMQQLEECPPDMAEGPMPAQEGTPVTVNVSMNASGKEHVADLLNMMKNAGLGGAKPMSPDMMPMRTDMERLRNIVDEPVDDPEIPGRDDVDGDQDLQAGTLGKLAGGVVGGVAGAALGGAPGAALGALGGAAAGDEITDDEDLDEYDNSPEEEYKDHKYMTKDLSGGINREKKAYKAAQRGDNAMAVEDIAKQLYAALAEKKAKPDFLDMDGDGDKKEPMKKAIKDKKAKKK